MSLIDNKSFVGVQSNMAGGFFNSNSFFNSNFERFFNSNNSMSVDACNPCWIIDSGANQHITNSDVLLSNVVDVSGLELNVGHPNGTKAKITKIGDLKFSKDLILSNVLVVPEYCVSLLSVHNLTRNSKVCVVFDENVCYIQDLVTRKVLGVGKEKDGLYLFDFCSKDVESNLSVKCLMTEFVWHNRLGHPSNQVLQVLGNKLNLSLNHENSFCEICHRAKQTRVIFSK